MIASKLPRATQNGDNGASNERNRGITTPDVIEFRRAVVEPFIATWYCYRFSLVNYFAPTNLRSREFQNCFLNDVNMNMMLYAASIMLSCYLLQTVNVVI